MVKNVPSKLVAMMRFQSAKSVLYKARPLAIPALATQIWMGLRAAKAAAMVSHTEVSSVTSITAGKMPFLRASCKICKQRPVMVTSAPSLASRWAIACPMPVPPPLTRAFFAVKGHRGHLVHCVLPLFVLSFGAWRCQRWSRVFAGRLFVLRASATVRCRTDWTGVSRARQTGLWCGWLE